MSRVSKEAEDQGFSDKEEKLPVRMVMNENTLTLFQDDTYKTMLMSFLLEDTKFARIANTPCFQLLSNNNQAKICEIESTTPNFVEEWDYDFHLFQIQCKKNRPEVQLDDAEEKKLEQDYKDSVDQAKLDVVREKQKALKKAVEETEELEMKKNVKKTQNMTVQAVKKEMQLERMLEKEEKEKEAIETKELVQQITQEKKKKDCLIKVIKEREMEDQLNLAKEQSEAQINELKEEAKKEITIKRNEMKTKILNMRKKNERKKNMLRQKLMSVRTEIADSLQLASKKGSKQICEVTKGDQEKINIYCEGSFPDDFYKLNDCKDQASFCYVCCENEFGAMFVGERDDCYNMCDKKPIEKPRAEEHHGVWQWDPDTEN